MSDEHTEVEDRIQQIQKRAEDTYLKWNILLAQNDRHWLLEQVERLQTKNRILQLKMAG